MSQVALNRADVLALIEAMDGVAREIGSAYGLDAACKSPAHYAASALAGDVKRRCLRALEDVERREWTEDGPLAQVDVPAPEAVTLWLSNAGQHDLAGRLFDVANPA